MNEPDWNGLFRREYGAIVASIVKRLGRLDVAEDAAQESLARAVVDWRAKGSPANPGGWLMQVAWRCAIDAVRQSGRQEALPADAPAAPAAEAGDALVLLALCAHPSLSREDQVALTLKAACGFGTAEIARAFFVDEAALAQRLVRAKNKLRDEEPRPGAPEAVLDVIYIAFNEGYTPRDGEETLRADVALEALRLARLASGQSPAAQALAALLCFQASRLAARVGPDGALVPLEEQDRSRWDRSLVDEGLGRLARAAAGEALSEYHLLAGIAACHSTEASVEATDWPRIASLYGELERRTPTWVVKLNRAVAISFADGPAAGLAALDRLAAPPSGAAHHFHAARADALRRLSRPAAAEYRRAAEAAPTRAERRFLERKATSAP